MLKCKDCIHRESVPGSAHISCDRGTATILNANPHGIASGWFMFPFNFDPAWAEECIGFVDKNIDITTLNRKELIEIFAKEWITIMEIKKQVGFLPINLNKISVSLEKLKVKKGNTPLQETPMEDLREIIRLVQKV